MLLKRRVNGNNGGTLSKGLPLTSTFPTPPPQNTATTKTNVLNKSSWKLAKRCLYSFCLCFILLIAGIIGSFYLYLQFMTRYNARNAQDPCTVASNSIQTLRLLEKSGRQLSEIKTITTKDGEIVQGFNNNEFKPELPKIIHQQWKDQNVPKKFIKWRKKWLEFFPEDEYTHMLWDDQSGRDLIKDHYPWFLNTFDGYQHNINRVDATRYFILYHYGGIYADLDYEILTPELYQYLPTNMVGIIESPYFWNEKTQNALMSSPKFDPFWVDVFEKLIQNARKSNILEVSGPILMDQAMEASLSPAYVLPCENFQRVPIGEYTETIHSIVAEREMKFRLKPVSGKQCGLYSNPQCHFGRHHNTVSYVRTNNGGGIL